ncbi:MAG: ShlB/FhaC/HecB family hemolysin secretion/activation protein [Deltaproteobacteria bacterium]|nr:ShlB/FhaC/HecB family hemolysin secretion/activation protein [Deltaproteobacteria bacterium]
MPDVRMEGLPAAPEPGRIPTDETPCFKIDRIVLIGDSSEKFQWALDKIDTTDDGQADPTISRCLGSRGINILLHRAQNAILKRGYVTTRVLAPPQDLKGGELKLTIIPGRVRNIRFAEGTLPGGSLWNAIPASPGDLLNLRDIEQGLENLKRVPSAEADIQIVPAAETDAKPGESDLVITWRQAFPLRLTLAADDSGAKATGKYQGSATLSLDNILSQNELMYLTLNNDLGGSDPGDGGTFGYTGHISIPYGYWLSALTSSGSRYHQSVAGANQTYSYRGRSTNSELKLSRLIYRDARRKTTLSAGGWLRSSKNFIDDTEVEVQRRRMAGWFVGINHKEFIGPATLELGLHYKRGEGILDSLPAPEEPFGEGTSRPEIITATIELNIPIKAGPLHLRYSGAWRAQKNLTPLIPQDRFSIGGRYTVRGFDGENLLLGDSGWVLRNDFGWQIFRPGLEAYLGVDYGEVSGPSSELLLGKHLSGGVLGLRGSYKVFFYDLFMGTPISTPKGFKADSLILGFSCGLSLP